MKNLTLEGISYKQSMVYLGNITLEKHRQQTVHCLPWESYIRGTRSQTVHCLPSQSYIRGP